MTEIFISFKTKLSPFKTKRFPSCANHHTLQKDYAAKWKFAGIGILDSKACIKGYVQPFCSD